MAFSSTIQLLFKSRTNHKTNIWNIIIYEISKIINEIKIMHYQLTYNNSNQQQQQTKNSKKLLLQLRPLSTELPFTTTCLSSNVASWPRLPPSQLAATPRPLAARPLRQTSQTSQPACKICALTLTTSPAAHERQPPHQQDRPSQRNLWWFASKYCFHYRNLVWQR